MFVSTLTRAVVRARTFAPGEKMSVFAVVNTGNILKKGSHWASIAFQIKKRKEGQFLKCEEFARLFKYSKISNIFRVYR